MFQYFNRIFFIRLIFQSNLYIRIDTRNFILFNDIYMLQKNNFVILICETKRVDDVSSTRSCNLFFKIRIFNTIKDLNYDLKTLVSIVYYKLFYIAYIM